MEIFYTSEITFILQDEFRPSSHLFMRWNTLRDDSSSDVLKHKPSTILIWICHTWWKWWYVYAIPSMLTASRLCTYTPFLHPFPLLTLAHAFQFQISGTAFWVVWWERGFPENQLENKHGKWWGLAKMCMQCLFSDVLHRGAITASAEHFRTG